MPEDTIAAISTPSGSGGIAVLRVSGPSAIPIVDKLFRGKKRLSEAQSHKAYFGQIVDANRNGQANPRCGASRFLDEVIVTIFRAPNSYTREDVVEISCHGGQFLSSRILDLLVNHGARVAEPGEFSKRAFLNGRLDLSQAEAVADIIRAKSELNLRAALSQYEGVFSNRIKNLRQELVDTCSLLELELDFAEEDVEFAAKTEVETKIKGVIQNIEDLLSTFERGRILREGARLVIVGRPNVGKSSLMNALLKEERAIVTEVPGTTRDVLEEQLNINGVYFRVIDTAGVRTTKNRIEKEGVTRTLKQIQEADILLFLFDGSQPMKEQDISLVEQVFALRGQKDGSRKRMIAAINKIDLKRKLTNSDIQDLLGDCPTLEISAKEFVGFKELEDVLVGVSLGDSGYSQDEPLVTNLRQKVALEHATQSLHVALGSVKRGLSWEFVAIDLRGAANQLGEVIGAVTTEDILGNIFSKFCIGK